MTPLAPPQRSVSVWQKVLLSLIGFALLFGVCYAAVLSYSEPKNLIALVPFTLVFGLPLALGMFRIWS